MEKPSASAPPVVHELAEHLASGVVIYVATANAERLPEAMFAMGAKLDCERRLLSVYLAPAGRTGTLENIARDPRIAITMTRPSTHKSVQVKGKVVRVRDANDADRDVQAVHRAALVEQLASIGLPRVVTRRIVWWPSVAVEVAVSDVFTQTPGPRAGERLASL